MRSIFKRMFAVAASAAMVITAAGCGGAVPTAAGVSTETEAGGILLTAAPAERGDLALSTAFIGSVAPDQVVSVMPKMGGTVKAVNVTVGQQVKKGELLMTLDDKDVMPSYNQAKAVYDSTKAQMDQRMGSGYKSDLSRLDTAYDQAFDAYENAKGNVDIADNAVATARAELAADPNDPAKKAALAAANAKADMADSALVTSRKYFNNARSSYDAMKTEGEVELQAVVDATLSQAEAGLNMAKQQLDNTKLYSPIDGIIETVAVTSLNAVSPSSPAFVIANKSTLAVTFNVSSAAVMSMEVGDTVNVEKGQNKYTATITEVGKIVNPQTGLFTVKAAMESINSEMLTGVTVKVSADTEKTENALLISQDSLYYDDGVPYVYLVTEGENGAKLAKKTFVKTGISNPERIEIISGISEKDLVITSWHPNLIDGATVALAPQEG